ncbi:hypothetical protein MMC21_004852 [Puttea exsequens]|nr:hypothetical protein [Puttea exsequens]
MQFWNPADPFATEQRTCMHHLVEAKAREIPNAEAICAWDGSLTHAEINRLSDLAAHLLLRKGVRRGQYVPFAYEKSMWAVIATLAILKAGAAFVPLNPRDPPVRLSEILQSVGARVVATTSAFVPIFDDLVDDVVVIAAETIHSSLCCGPVLNGHIPNGAAASLDKPTTSADPIFVLFTSGSTGKPKGMVHTHASICTHAMTHGEAMGYHGARVLQFAAHTFDVAIIDIYTTLLFGGCICIPSEEDRRTNIVAVINTMKVDYAILTPSFAGVIEPMEVPTLKTLAVGGEALPQDRIERWADKVRFIQIYGPAETGICHTVNMQSTTRPETIGYPLPNCSCWLVDPDNSDRLLPIGAAGELVVAGPSLAQGYLNDEAKTRLAFIDTPAWAKRLGLPEWRLYKTGDLLRYDVGVFDGSYTFVGRKDTQIKLRGQRIEPGEVEYHIGRLPGVSMSMVTRPTEGNFAEELIAVVQMQAINSEKMRVGHDPIRLADVQALSIEIVQESLARALPGYMIPSACLVVENMPFVLSLKIDRRQVSAWLAKMETRPWKVEPNTFARLGDDEVTARDLSLKAAEILSKKRNGKWSLLENCDFVLQKTGIDSIQIISLSMYLQNRYKRKIPMNTLLDSDTTIRQLAQLIDGSSTLPIDKHTSLPANQSFPTTPDLIQEAHALASDLFATISPQTQNPENLPSPHPLIQNILLTGVTGYLGISILHHLLATPSLTIYALVRCSNPSTGLATIIAAAKYRGWWQETYASRVHVWPGDLSLPSLALSPAHMNLIRGTGCNPSEAVHAIIHSGATVHYSTAYPSLKATNVLSTLQLLRLIAHAPLLSSFVFLSGGVKPSLDTSAPDHTYLDHLGQAGGYTQSKFVCERVLTACGARAAFWGKTLRTVKPGYIVGSAREGRANRKDFVWRVVAGCVEIGAFNREEKARWLYIASDDCVAERAVGCVFGCGSLDREGSQRFGGVERVLEGLYFSELWAVVEEIYGCGLEPLGEKEWMRRLKRRVLEVGEEHLLFPLLDVLERDGGNLGDGEVQDGGKSSEDTRAVVRRNLQYLIEVGFLPSPGTPTLVGAGAIEAAEG